MNGIPSLAVFTDHLGETFQIRQDADQSWNVTLIGVKPLKAYAGAPRQELLSLLFRGPREIDLPQSLHALEHEQLGTLFLVPIAPDAEGAYFESLIN